METYENIESIVRRYHVKFQADKQTFDAWNGAWTGFKATGISILSDTRIDELSKGGSWITYEATREEQPWEQEVYRWVRFRSCGTVGYGPTMWVKGRKGGDVLRDHASKVCQRIAYQLCRQQSSVPRARDEENHSPARWTRRAVRQSSRPSVVTEMSSTVETGSHWQNCTPGVFT